MNYFIKLYEKTNWAPFTYVALQIAMTGCIIVTCSYFTQLSLGSVIFWIDVALTIIFYFITHSRDPGYITLADLQITDSSQPLSFINRNLQEQRQKQSSSEFIQKHNISEIKQKTKLSDENVELYNIDQVDDERLQNEHSIANSPKQIKSLNHSDEEEKEGSNKHSPKSRGSPKSPEAQMVCEMSESDDPKHTGSFGKIDVSVQKHFKSINTSQLKFRSSVLVQTNGNGQTEGSTKETNQPTQIPYQIKIACAESINDVPLQSPNHQNLSNKIEIRLDDEHQVYIERRYCNQCNQDQLIRSKHCKDCKHCVACYDHHCPWMGNCIGERNKCPFYWFIIFQLIQITIVCVQLQQQIDWSEKYFSSHIYIFLVIIILVYYLVMVACLLFYHTYLAFINLTTWENVSWHRISYLKDLPEENGSPFNKGFLTNLRNFCRFKIPAVTNWDYNQDTLRYVKH